MSSEELDLKVMLYHFFKNWRVVCIIMVVSALAAVGIGLRKPISVMNSPEKLSAEQKIYESNLQSWELNGEQLKSSIAGLGDSIHSLNDYISNSPVMQIDPFHEYVGKITFYIDSNYTIMPTVTYQNIDYTGRILSAYLDYILNFEMCDELVQRFGLATESRYLAEVIDASSDETSASLDVTVKCSCEIDAETLLDQISVLIYDKTEEIKNIFTDYEISVISKTCFTRIDRDIETLQKEKRDTLLDQAEKLTTLSAEFNSWEDEKPVYKFTTEAVLYKTIKMLIIGFAVGIIVVFCIFAGAYIVSRKVHEDGVWASPDMIIFGYLRLDQRRKHWRKIDQYIEQLFGYAPSVYDANECASMIGASVKNWMSENKVSSLAAIGTEPCESSERAVAALRANSAANVSYVGNILTSGKANSDVASFDAALLFVRENVTTWKDIQQQRILLEAWGKKIAGAVCFR